MHVKLASSNFLYDFSVTKLFLWHSIFVSFLSIQHIQNSQHTQGVIDFSVVLPLPSNLQFHVQKTADYDMMWGQKALHPLSEPTPFNCDMGWLIEIFDNTLPRIEAFFFSSVAWDIKQNKRLQNYFLQSWKTRNLSLPNCIIISHKPLPHMSQFLRRCRL